MTPLDSLLPLVLPFATNCPEPTAISNLRLAARDFCQRTKIWREGQTVALTVPPGQVTLVAPAQAVLLDLDRVDWAGKPVDQITWDEFRDQHPEWETATGRPCAIAQEMIGGPFLISPVDAGDLKVWAYWMPSRTATSIPDFLAERFAERLADGALSYILRLPDEPYTNPTEAATRAAVFNACVASHVSFSEMGQQRAALRTRPSFF